MLLGSNSARGKACLDRETAYEEAPGSQNCLWEASWIANLLLAWELHVGGFWPATCFRGGFWAAGLLQGDLPGLKPACGSLLSTKSACGDLFV